MAFCRLFILVPGEILCDPNIFAVELYKSARIARRNNLSSLAALLIWKQIPFSFFEPINICGLERYKNCLQSVSFCFDAHTTGSNVVHHAESTISVFLLRRFFGRIN